MSWADERRGEKATSSSGQVPVQSVRVKCAAISAADSLRVEEDDRLLRSIAIA